MTILQIITSSRCWAGMEQYAFDVSREMIARGHRVVFVIADDGDVVYPRFQEIGKVYLLPLKSKFDVASIRGLKKIVRREKPDIIHTHQPKNIFHAFFAGGREHRPKIVHTLHFRINPTSPQWLYSWIFTRPARLIAVSELVRRRVMEVYPRLRPEQVVTVLNSIDTRRFGTPSEAEERHAVPVIGYAGRLVPEKGVEVLIRAAGKLKREGFAFRLRLAGVGLNAYRDRLERLTQEEGIASNTEFMGFVKEMGRFIDSLDIAALPSVVSEAGSLMLLEYMAAGKTVVASNNGSQGEVVDDGENGLLVPPADVDALTGALRNLLTDGERCRSMGAAAKEKFDRELSFAVFIDRTTAVYRAALEK